MARVTVNINSKKLEHILYEADCLHLTAEKALEIKQAAMAIYLSERKLPDHNDYLSSFEIVKHGKSYIVRNTDDTAFYVEFGVYSDTRLGYAPLRRAIDVVSSTQ